MRELLASERGGLLEQQQEMLPFLTFLCWVAIRTSCPSCSPKGNPWTYRILTLIFNCTHRLSCLDSKQKSYKILVNATNCVKFWRGEGINMTVEEMTAALYLFCPFSVQSHLKLVLLSFRHLRLGAHGSTWLSFLFAVASVISEWGWRKDEGTIIWAHTSAEVLVNAVQYA